MNNKVITFKTDCAVCNLGGGTAELLINGKCKLFNCTEFRNEQCRKKVATENMPRDAELTQTWLDDSEFIVRLTHPNNTPEGVLNLLNEIDRTWANMNKDFCDCPLEGIIHDLKKQILTYLNKS